MDNHKFVYKKHPEHKKIAYKRLLAWLSLIVFLTIAVYLVEQNITTFQASIIPTQQAAPFDGMVMPIQKTPDWVALSTEEWKQTYNQLPSSKLQKIPEYDPQKLKISTDLLKWGNPTDDAIRNAKITYSVPYMGNYKLDGKEYAGSHLAVDIKIPSGTPVYAIGNGIVAKTSEQNYGFGRHIVIEHKNFPSFDNPGNNENYYSSYSHMQTINVTEGSVVKKGDVIGYSGNTGTTTTPHLHFQIDNSNAPWHPFWPFTSKEASDAGLSFTEAVNQGLNKDVAMANTINPLIYIQKYLDGSVSQPFQEPEPEPDPEPVVEPEPDTQIDSNDDSSSRYSSRSSDDRNESTNTDEDDSSDTDTISTNDLDEDVATSNGFTFLIETDSVFTVDESMKFLVKAVDKSGQIIERFSVEKPVDVEVIQGKATVYPERLTNYHFRNGIAKLTLTPKGSNPVKIAVKTDAFQIESNTIYSDSADDSDFVDESNSIFVDISDMHPHFKAISFLKNEGVIQGYPDGTFKPDVIVTRVEVLKFILEGIQAQIDRARALPFADTDISEWYADYVYTGNNLGIVQGYPDRTFKPGDPVNKVEFLKILIEAMNIDIDPNVEDLPYDDISEDEWYAPYVQFALEKNIIDIEGPSFEPTADIKREEVAEAMYRIKLLKMTGANIYTEDLETA